MTANDNDIVRVARGSLSQVQIWHDLLQDAGIESRVVGDNLTAGLGTALPGAIELWIHSGDAGAVETALTRADGRRERRPLPTPHSASDPRPDDSHEPRRGAPPLGPAG